MPETRPIKKAVEVIHIGNRLSLFERRAFNVLLWHAYPNLLKEDKHKLSGKKLRDLLDYRSTNQKPLKDALHQLMTTDIELVNRVDSWVASTFLASVKLSKGMCEYAFSPHLKEFLYHPKIFSRFFLEIQKRFSRSTTLALYENCKRYQRVKSTGWKTVDEWRSLLGVDDHPHYQDFRQFNAKVLKPSMKELNETSDIKIAIEYRKDGRRVEKIKFKISANPQPTLFEQPEEKDDLEDRYKEIVSGMDKQTLKMLQDRFISEILKDSPTLLARYNSDGFESRIIQIAFQEFVVENASTEPK